MSSEIAQLRQQIEQEHRAACWALEGLSSGEAQHAFIARRMGHLEISYAGLKQLVGEEQATDILCQVFEQTPTKQTQQH
ncbi:MAG TPA: hypothetical protein VHD63_13640 [Ktedonobacteraceae bacterium]|nr:hypothetical protein [Ktedonobacteraceae bacterium]